MDMSRNLPWNNVRWCRVLQLRFDAQPLDMYYLNGWDIGPIVAQQRRRAGRTRARSGDRKYYRFQPAISQPAATWGNLAMSRAWRPRLRWLVAMLLHSETLQKCIKRVAESVNLT